LSSIRLLHLLPNGADGRKCLKAAFMMYSFIVTYVITSLLLVTLLCYSKNLEKIKRGYYSALPCYCANCLGICSRTVFCGSCVKKLPPFCENATPWHTGDIVSISEDHFVLPHPVQRSTTAMV